MTLTMQQLFEREQASNKRLRRINENLSAQIETLLRQNNEIMQASMQSILALVWDHGDMISENRRELVVSKATIKDDVPLLQVAVKEDPETGDKRFVVKRLTEEEVEAIRQKRLSRLQGVDPNAPRIIVPE